MADKMDLALGMLRSTRSPGDLDRLEQAVWATIDRNKRGDAFGGRTLQVQFAVTCGALILGLLVAQFVGGSRPLMSEIAVLSDDSFLAPSVRLEGGI